jgi:hypothetical protein
MKSFGIENAVNGSGRASESFNEVKRRVVRK